MNKTEAITAMLQSKKLSHRFFSPGEWITMADMFTIILSCGTRCDAGLFWHFRCSSEWKSGWELLDEKSTINNEYIYRSNKKPGSLHH